MCSRAFASCISVLCIMYIYAQLEASADELQTVEQIFIYFINNTIITLPATKIVAGVNLVAENNYNQ